MLTLYSFIQFPVTFSILGPDIFIGALLPVAPRQNYNFWHYGLHALC